MFDLHTAHGWLRLFHIVPGFIGLAAFWVPVFATKGGKLHVRLGQVFAACALLVILTAMTSAGWILLAPESFARTPGPGLRFVGELLGALAVFTLEALVLSVWAVWTRRTPERLASGGMLAVLALMAFVSVALIGDGVVRLTNDDTAYGAILLALGVAGFRGAAKSYKQITDPNPPRMRWWYLHMEYMLTTGIAFHTAFAVFGLSRLIGNYLTGPWQLVPWLLPSVLGVPATVLWVRAYRNQFERTSPAGETP